jgi:pyruvate carboxylase subunit B
LLGGYGKPPAPVNESLRSKAVGNEEVMEGRPADDLLPELENLRKEIGALAKSEEDVLTYAMFPDLGREFLQQREDGTLTPEVLLPMGQGKAISDKMATEFKIDVHGEIYEVAVTGVGSMGGNKRKLYISLDGMPEEVTFEALNEYDGSGKTSQRKQVSAPGDVTATMPGNVVEVLVKEGDVVTAGQSVMVMEAMKMETELHTSIAGKVKAVHTAKGDRVTPGEVLIEIE